MVAADTNVLVRFLTRDDPRQARRAAALFKDSQVWVAKSVLLETEWVLRSLYGFPPKRIVAALRLLAGLPHTHLEDPSAVSAAMEWFAGGLDFADALHLASRGDSDRFATFDQRLAKRVGKQAAIAIVRL